MIPELLEAIAKDDGSLFKLGEDVGRLYSDVGLPIDMSLDKLQKDYGLQKEQKIVVLHGALHWLVEHKRSSGATEKSIERQRKNNLRYIESFIKTGECGVY